MLSSSFPPATLHVVVYICQRYSQFILPSPSPVVSTSAFSKSASLFYDFLVFLFTLISPLTCTVESGSVKGGSSALCCLPQTRVIAEILMCNVPTYVGAAWRLMSVPLNSELKVKSIWNGYYNYRILPLEFSTFCALSLASHLMSLMFLLTYISYKMTCCSVTQSCPTTPWTAAHQASLSFTISPRACSNSCPLSR